MIIPMYLGELVVGEATLTWHALAVVVWLAKHTFSSDCSCVFEATLLRGAHGLRK